MPASDPLPPVTGKFRKSSMHRQGRFTTGSLRACIAQRCRQQPCESDGGPDHAGTGYRRGHSGGCVPDQLTLFDLAVDPPALWAVQRLILISTRKMSSPLHGEAAEESSCGY